MSALAVRSCLWAVFAGASFAQSLPAAGVAAEPKGGALPISAAIPPGATATTSSFSNSPSLAIIDLGTVSDSIVVFTTDVYLWDLDVLTDITHTFCEDLDITLTSPVGTVITLTTDNGGGFDNVFLGTLWDDTVNDVPCTDAAYANLVTASPLNSEGSLDRFRGEDPNGAWTLTITDDASTDLGTLASWSLDVTTLTAAPNEVTTCFSSSPALALPDLTTTSATMNVVASGTFLQRLRVYTEIQHTWPADLDMVLTSPSNKVMRLGTDNGGSTVNGFAGTMWDENAPTPVTDAFFVNGEVMRLTSPEGALGTFIGENPNGIWTLSITDDAGADVGTLDRWWLLVTTDGTGPPYPTIDYCDVISGTGTPPLDLSPKTLFVQPGDAATWRISNAFAHSVDTLTPLRVATTARITYTSGNPSTGPNPVVFAVTPAGGADMQFSIVIECAASAGAYTYDFELYDQLNALLCTIDPVIFIGTPVTVSDCQILPTVTQTCQSVAAAVGTPSANAGSGFTTTFSGLNAQVTGVAFYGVNGPNSASWSAESNLCVKSPFVRLNGVAGAFGNTGGTTGSCNGQYSFDFNSVILNTGIPASTLVILQGWQRDPAAAKTTNMTDALSFVVGP